MNDVLCLKLWCLLIGTWSLPLLSFGQKNSNSITKSDSLVLEHIQAQITLFQKEGVSDSIIHYYHEQSEWYKNKNLLAKWYDSYWDLQDNFDRDSALIYLEEAVNKQWRSPSHDLEAESLLWIYASQSFYYFQKGEIYTCIKTCERADLLYEVYQLEDFDMVEQIYKRLGTCYTMIGDNEKAQYIYEKALDLALPEQNPRNLGGLYNNIGITYWNQGENEEAIRFYEKGIKLKNLPEEQAGLLNTSLAQSYLEIGRIEAAAKKAQIAITQLKSAWSPEQKRMAQYLSTAYLIQGRIVHKQGNNAYAKDHLNQALKMAAIAFDEGQHRYTAKIFMELGRLYFEEENYLQAIDHFNKALSSVIPTFTPSEKQENPLAEYFHEENAIYEALEGKADAFERLGELENALHCHELALQAEEKIRKVLQNESARLFFQADRRRRTNKVIDICYRLHEQTRNNTFAQKAFLLAEQSRASLLREAVEENLTRHALEQGDTLWKQEIALKRIYTYYDKEYLLAKDTIEKRAFLVQKNKVGDQIKYLKEQIFQKYPQYQSIDKDTSFEYLNLTKAIQKNQQETLIEYFVGQKFVYAFVIQDPNKAPKLYQLDESEKLAQEVQAFLTYFKSPQLIGNNRNAYLTTAHSLYQQLITPLFPELALPEKLIVIPDGILNYIPFEALITETSKANWSKVPFLLRHSEIRYAHSMFILNLWQAQSIKNTENILAVAPVFKESPRGLPTLNFSGAEINNLKVDGTIKLLEQGATRNAFLQNASKYRILHLSTHAQGGTENEPPSLELIDGPLFLPEIYGLALKAELVVLSACETNLGQLEEGEGVMSLGRGFAYAGSSSLIASLWRVNEGSTVRLFSDFYEKIKTRMPKSEALTATKVDYLEDPNILGPHKSPYYWASFVYFGNNSSIQLKSSKISYGLPILCGAFIFIALILYLKYKKSISTVR